MAKRPRPTLFDYALLGINPALIMLMVGSLAFFLVAVLYRGEFELRLCFILSMFVMAVVLITRISVEEGAQYASLFAIPLAFVVFIALGRFVTFPGGLAPLSLLINAGLMALIWWSSHQITWDCTVIDESVEAPGEGLLQTAGFDAGNRDGVSDIRDREATSDTAAPSRGGESESGSRPIFASLWGKYREHLQRPHSHGMWVVYFAIAALPIFGIGQGFVDSLAGRRYVFFLFCVYLLSSLALLMTTSLLGLRRYLRQRHLEMPASMPVAWFGTGGLLIVAVLLLCLILPRPYPEYSISHLDWFASSPVSLKTNFWGTFEGKQSPDGRSGSAEPSSPDSQTPNSGASSSGQSSQGQSSQGQSSQGQSSQGQSSQGQSSQGQPNQGQPNQGQPNQGQPNQGQPNQGQSSQGQSNQGQPGQGPSSPSQPAQGQAGREQQAQPSSVAEEPGRRESNAGSSSASASRSASSESNAERRGVPESSSTRSPSALPTVGSVVGGSLKFLYYLTVLVVLAYLSWRFRDQLRDGWQRFLNELQRLREKWGHLPPSTENAKESIDTVPVRRARPFSEFSNPFRHRGGAERSPEELLRYTFSALEAWGREHEVERRAEETPLEFAQRLGVKHPEVARVGRDVSLLYSQLAYGPGELPRETAQHLQRFWRLIELRQSELDRMIAS